jgi:hypothetical protein
MPASENSCGYGFYVRYDRLGIQRALSRRNATPAIKEKFMASTKELEQHLQQSLDVSNFKTLEANASKPISNEAQLKSASEQAIHTQIDQIKQYATLVPDGELVHANSDLLTPGAALETWTAGPGDFSISSAYGWAIGGGVPFPGLLPLSFLFGGTGKSWKAWATGTCVTAGSFVQDPNKICLSKDFHTEDSGIGKVRKGFCNFVASGGGAGISEVNISFYSTGGTFWGTLAGTGLLAGYFSVEGQLELVWQGWR